MCSVLAFSQNTKVLKKRTDGTIVNPDSTRVNSNSTSNRKLKNDNITIKDYLIISQARDTVLVDTSLTIKSHYKFNYLRKDDFGLIPFSNMGQTYNTLSQNLQSNKTMPSFGAQARHFNYMALEDTKYYKVGTPFTDLFYKTGFEQGQVLDAIFAVNTSERFNMSIAYKGNRSLGKYQHILTSTGNFRFSSNFQSKDGKYTARGHIYLQDLLNEENGGLKDENIDDFESGNPEFIDRSVFDPNFENAENILVGKRFYLDHQYQLIKANDSLTKNNLSIGNVILFEDKFYKYEQTNSNTFFGDSFSSSIYDKVTLEDLYIEANAKYSNAKFGNFGFKVAYDNYNYGYDKIVVLNGQQIPNRLKSDLFKVGGNYTNTFGKLNISGLFDINLAGDWDGSVFDIGLNYTISKFINLEAKVSSTTRMPNYNFLLFQSDYLNYNWDNSNTFNAVKTNQIAFSFISPKYVDLLLDYTLVDNYTYFSNASGSVKPVQSDEDLSYFRVRLNKEFKFKKFGFDNSIMYQSVLDGDTFFKAPSFVTRNTLYYGTKLFKNNLQLQTGVVFNYFSEYHMNAYDPLLAEFYVQDTETLGSFPRFDVFINARIRQTRIYFSLEHLNSSWTGYNYYSAPNNPYRDFTLRFGLEWNFFL